MNILLIKATGTSIQNPSVTPQLGIIYLASYLNSRQYKNHRYEEKIID